MYESPRSRHSWLHLTCNFQLPYFYQLFKTPRWSISWHAVWISWHSSYNLYQHSPEIELKHKNINHQTCSDKLPAVFFNTHFTSNSCARRQSLLRSYIKHSHWKNILINLCFAKKQKKIWWKTKTKYFLYIKTIKSVLHSLGDIAWNWNYSRWRTQTKWMQIINSSALTFIW